MPEMVHDVAPGPHRGSRAPFPVNTSVRTVPNGHWSVVSRSASKQGSMLYGSMSLLLTQPQRLLSLEMRRSAKHWSIG